MRSWSEVLVFSLAAIGYVVYCVADADGGPLGCHRCGAPNECCYQQVVVDRCKLVPDNKPIKKIVYELKEVPYCSHKLSGCHDCDCCPECQACPKYKKQLVKKEITCGEKQGTKCVVEQCVEWVAIPCTRCGHAGHCK